MTNKEKIRVFLVGMADADCCNTQVAKAINKIILPYLDTLQEEYKLTLQDIKRVILLEHHVIADDRCHHKLMTQEDLCKEILKRINDEQTS